MHFFFLHWLLLLQVEEILWNITMSLCSHFILSCVQIDQWGPCQPAKHATCLSNTLRLFTLTYLHWRQHLSPAWWCLHWREKSSCPIFHSCCRERLQNHLIMAHMHIQYIQSPEQPSLPGSHAQEIHLYSHNNIQILRIIRSSLCMGLQCWKH